MITSNTKSQHKILNWIYVFRFSLWECHYSCYFTKQKKIDSIREHCCKVKKSVLYLVSYWRADDPEACLVFGVFIGVVWRGDDSTGVCESTSTIHWVVEKKREWHINKYFDSRKKLAYTLLYSFFKPGKDEENISAIDFHCLAFLSAAVPKELKT